MCLVTVEPTTAIHPVYDELVNALIDSSLHDHTGTIANPTTVPYVLSTATSSPSTISYNSLSSPSSSLSSSSHLTTSYPLIVMTPVVSVVKEETSSSMTSPTPISHSSQVITVATDAINKSKEITLPTNNVKIFASTWPELSEGV